jgi:hypothetical protein
MAFRAVVLDPMTEAVPPQWAELAARPGVGPLWDPRLLRGMAWCAPRPALLGLVLDGDVPRALFHGRRRGPLPGHRYFSPTGRPGAGVLECALPPGVTSAGHVLDPGLDAAGRREALRVFERAVAARLGPRCLGVVYRQVGPAEAALFRRRGRLVLPVAPQTVVRNRWATFDDYLADLPRSRRRKLVAVRRATEDDPDLVAAVEPAIPAVEASRLAHQVRLRHSPTGTAAPIPVPFFEQLAGRPGVAYFTYRDRTGRLLAYSLLLDDGLDLTCLAWGARDRLDGGRPNLYLDHYLRQIEHLIRHGRREMAMGKGLDELKQRFGGTRSELYAAAALR